MRFYGRIEEKKYEWIFHFIEVLYSLLLLYCIVLLQESYVLFILQRLWSRYLSILYRCLLLPIFFVLLPTVSYFTIISILFYSLINTILNTPPQARIVSIDQS